MSTVGEGNQGERKVRFIVRAATVYETNSHVTAARPLEGATRAPILCSIENAGYCCERYTDQPCFEAHLENIQKTTGSGLGIPCDTDKKTRARALVGYCFRGRQRPTVLKCLSPTLFTLSRPIGCPCKKTKEKKTLC